MLQGRCGRLQLQETQIRAGGGPTSEEEAEDGS
jgi:hypothetical protein